MCSQPRLGKPTHPRFLTFAGTSEEDRLAELKNILQMDYQGNIAFTIAIVCLLFAIFAAAPLCMLPAKESFEELVFPRNGMNFMWNLIVTFVMVVCCYILAIAIPQISDVFEIVGSTTNPLVSFSL